jgi:hypothetical protein
MAWLTLSPYSSVRLFYQRFKPINKSDGVNTESDMLETLNIAARSFNIYMNVWLIEPQRWPVLLGEDRINKLAVIFRRTCKITKGVY